MSNEYKDWLYDKIEENKALCEKYPFLLPRNDFTGNLEENYDYSYTWLDEIPYGWCKAFGLRICEEIKVALIAENCLEKYRILQIKEKFGQLTWYDNGHSDVVDDVLLKYEYISKFVCIECGKLFPEARMVCGGWVSPFCRECYPYKDYDKFCSKKEIADSISFEREIPIKHTWVAIAGNSLQRGRE
jgi:hypothetical protein